MGAITKAFLDKGVRYFSKHFVPVTLKDIPGDYGLIIFDPEANPPVYSPLSPSFATRDELLVWMQGFAEGWRSARGE